MSRIFLITGVNGIGKSTLISQLKDKLDESSFDIYDFDERGVPDNVGREWRQSETLHWITEGKENSKNTIVCGFMKFPEIEAALSQLGVSADICLLDADEDTISHRILGRYPNSESIAELERTMGKTPEKFAADNIWISSKFRQEAKEKNYPIVDTSNLSPKEVGQKIIEWILSK
jgi:RNase adaptor protein for sRNA GlmZ degradation